MQMRWRNGLPDGERYPVRLMQFKNPLYHAPLCISSNVFRSFVSKIRYTADPYSATDTCFPPKIRFCFIVTFTEPGASRAPRAGVQFGELMRVPFVCKSVRLEGEKRKGFARHLPQPPSFV